ncbi:MAG: hypothetical protein LAO03_16540 [Acidobacteriia bacterium]|nr:hypothetical protein [Terriglobia bacterium]
MSRMLSFALSVVVVVALCPAIGMAATEVKLDDIIAGHLDSIAKAPTRTATKSRVVEGTTQFKVLTGGAGTTDGKAVIVSDDRKLQLNMKFPSGNYHGERFICDGSKVQIATSTDAQNRSNFGQFVYLQDVLLREGLLGGVLTTAWPLLDLDGRKPKLSYEGTKTIDGKTLYDVRYKPKKSADVEIHLYFDPESFHHVLTVYTLRIQPQLVQGGQANSLSVPEMGGTAGIQAPAGADASQASGQQETRYRVEERFSDFKTVDGITLPNHYVIHFTQELQSGRSTILDWDTTATRILENVTLDPRNFQVK